MRILLTGDVFRPGQKRNIAWLARTLCPLLTELGHKVDVYLGTPLSFEEWVAQYFDCGMYMPGQLVIGFELPPGFRRSLDRWIDIRVHPLRFLPRRYFSVEASDDLAAATNRAIGETCVWVDRPAIQPVSVEGAACLTLQVQHDAALIGASGMITPADVLPELQVFAARFQRLLVVPHPDQPHNDWREAALAGIPNAEITLFPAYTIMASVPEMVTVSSSTGFEAPWLGRRPGCKPTMLRRPWWTPSAPIEITSRAFWEAALREGVGT